MRDTTEHKKAESPDTMVVDTRDISTYAISYQEILKEVNAMSNYVD